VDGSKVLQVILLGKNEHNSVVAVTPTRVDLSEKEDRKCKQ
jgi:hypothetical protein